MFKGELFEKFLKILERLLDFFFERKIPKFPGEESSIKKDKRDKKEKG